MLSTKYLKYNSIDRLKENGWKRYIMQKCIKGKQEELY